MIYLTALAENIMSISKHVSTFNVSMV